MSAITGVGGTQVPAANLRKAMTGLCTARDQARTSDTAAAKATFFDEAHDRLHDIAAALEAVDRTAASGLLVAKQQVEADLNAPAPARELAADLDQLATVTHDSLAQLEVTADPCPR